jgi:hypothetical protein
MTPPNERPTRSADAETVRALVPYSGYPLEPDRVDMHVGGLNALLAITSEWDGLPLAYRFDDTGEFGNAPIESQYWATWRSSRQQQGGSR